MLKELSETLKNHSGKFYCSMIHNEKERKTVEFKHLVGEPLDINALDALNAEFGHIPRLVDFYATWDSLVLYCDPRSEDSAFYFANPSEWAQLKDYFEPWIDLDEDEQDLLPDWIEHYQVIGEIPRSGNYLLMITAGENTGHIYEFEHDGFDFIFIAENLESCISTLLNPDPARLLEMASHLRFIEEDSFQWWIEELEFKDGRRVKTKTYC